MSGLSRVACIYRYHSITLLLARLHHMLQCMITEIVVYLSKGSVIGDIKEYVSTSQIKYKKETEKSSLQP